MKLLLPLLFFIGIAAQPDDTVPVGEIGAIESLLTMVGGRIVYAAGPFRRFEE